MVSRQGQLLKLYLQAQRRFSHPSAPLDVAKQRAELDAWGRRARFKLDVACTPADANGVPAEWVDTPGILAGRVLFYLHGGAYVSGSPRTHRALAANLAHVAGARALTVDYRLAPEHPFPAPVEDATAAYRWLLANDVQPAQTIVAGDSSGGGLALAILVALRDAGDPLPAASVCLSPWTDLAATGESWVARVKADLILEPPMLKEAAQLYLGDANPRTPLASPLYADLAGLPPLFIQVGTDEILLSDATRLADRAQAAGVDVTLDVWKGMMHGWQLMAKVLPEGRQALDRVGAFIRERVPEPGVAGAYTHLTTETQTSRRRP